MLDLVRGIEGEYHECMRIMPQSTIGKIAVLLILSMFGLFYAGASSVGLYDDVASGDSILADILARPLVAVSMLAGFVSGLTSFGLGLTALFKKKDHAFLVYVALVIGAMLIVLLIGEIVSPH